MSHGITDTDSMFSVNSRRQPPWHGLGVVLDEYPKSIDEALEKAGLGWKVSHGDVLVVKHPEWTDDFGTKHPPELIPAKGLKANVREDTGDVTVVDAQPLLRDWRPAADCADTALRFTELLVLL